MPDRNQPDWPSFVRTRLTLPGVPARRRNRIVAELSDHLEDAYREALARGASPAQARAEAERRLHDADLAADELTRSEPSPVETAARLRVERAESQLRSRGGPGTLLANMLRDLRDSIRSLRHRPGFAAVAVASLAVGIGANTAIFSIVNLVLLRPLPYERPEELVDFHLELPNTSFSVLSYPDFEDLRDGTAETFTGAIASQMTLVPLDDEPGVVGEAVTGNYFSVLGVRPHLGRLLGPADDRVRGGHPVVVLSYGYWQRRFDRDPDVIGREIRLGDRTYTVVGVGPADYPGIIRGILTPAFYTPIMMLDELMPQAGLLDARDNHNLFAKARLAPRVTLAQASAAVAAVATGLSETQPQGWDPAGTFQVVKSTDVVLDPEMDGGLRAVSWLLMVVVGLVLLLACVNLASFLLAQAMDRRRDVALRLALGATRGTLVRQFLVESTLLGLAGGGLGFALAMAVLRAAPRLDLGLPIALTPDLSPDARVLAFTFGVSMVAGTLLGLVPALQSTRPDVAATLKAETAAGGQPGRRRWRSALVVVQLTVSLMLLVGAGLFLRSLQRQYAVDPGFDRSRAVVLTIATPTRSTEAEGRDLVRRLHDRVEALPGVEAIGFATRLPVQAAAGLQWIDFTVDGHQPPPGQEAFQADRTMVDPGFFDAVGIPIVQGRAFTTADRADNQPVVIVSAAMARQFWPDGGAVGRFVHLRGGSPRLPGFLTADLQVVGVAADVDWRELGESPGLLAYVPYAQHYIPTVSFVVRTPAGPSETLRTLVATARAVEPALSVTRAMTLQEHVTSGLRGTEVLTGVLALFAGLTLALAVVGLYGAVSYVVATRTREVGIRMALGADARAVKQLLALSGARLVLLGGGLGLALGLPLMRLLDTLLFEVGTFDLGAVAGATLVLTATSLLAAYIPARRAGQVDPITALRDD